MSRIRQSLSTYNLFETLSSTAATQRRERLSTRLYLALMVGCLVIVVFYTGLVERTKTETIHNPSQSTYEYLLTLHTENLQCPCSNISVPYNNFTTRLSVRFHPVCTSDFVSSAWLTYINQFGRSATWWLQRQDFRKWGILFFDLIRSLCTLADATVSDAIQQLQSSLFLTTEAVPASQFRTQVNEVIELFQKSTSTQLTNSLKIFRASDQSNALFSLLSTNWMPQYGINASYTSLTSIPVTHSNGSCSCATSSSCLEPAGFYNMSPTRFYTIEGIFSGCTSLESILRSSLACFASSFCLSSMQNATSLGRAGSTWTVSTVDVVPLKFSSLTNRFNANDTIESIAYQMFIDSWSNETSYERYYNACAPVYCKYTFGRRVDVAYTLTTLLSVFKGLSMGLRFVVLFLVKVVFKVYHIVTVQRIQAI